MLFLARLVAIFTLVSAFSRVELVAAQAAPSCVVSSFDASALYGSNAVGWRLRIENFTNPSGCLATVAVASDLRIFRWEYITTTIVPLRAQIGDAQSPTSFLNAVFSNSSAFADVTANWTIQGSVLKLLLRPSADFETAWSGDLTVFVRPVTPTPTPTAGGTPPPISPLCTVVQVPFFPASVSATFPNSFGFIRFYARTTPGPGRVSYIPNPPNNATELSYGEAHAIAPNTVLSEMTGAYGDNTGEAWVEMCPNGYDQTATIQALTASPTSATNTSTLTPSMSPTVAAASTSTASRTRTVSRTPSQTRSSTVTQLSTSTPTLTPTATLTPTLTPTPTIRPTWDGDCSGVNPDRDLQCTQIAILETIAAGNKTQVVVYPTVVASLVVTVRPTVYAPGNFETAEAILINKEPFVSFGKVKRFMDGFQDVFVQNQDAPSCLAGSIEADLQPVPPPINTPFAIPFDYVERGFCAFVFITTPVRVYMRFVSVLLIALMFVTYVRNTLRRMGDV